MSRHVVWVAVALSTSCNCGPPSDNVVGTGARATAMIGPEGGTLTLEGLILTIPPNALTMTLPIEIDSTRDEPPAAYQSTSPVFRLLPAGTQFKEPVMVRITVATAADQALFWSDPDGTFQQVGAAPQAVIVLGQSTHFSDVFAGRRRSGVPCMSDHDCLRGLLCYTPDAGRGPGGCYPPRNEDDARALRAAPSCAFGQGAFPSETIADPSAEHAPAAIQYVFVLMLENRSFDHYFGRFKDYLNSPQRYVNPLLTHYQPPGPGDDPRVSPFDPDPNHRDAKGRPFGVDVPGKPYDQMTRAEQDQQDLIFDPRASSADFVAAGTGDAPYNPVVAGLRPGQADEKHYWRHAGDAVDPVTLRPKYLPSQPNTCYLKPNDVEQCVSDTCHEWWCSHMEWNSGRMDGFFEANDGYWEGAEPKPTHFAQSLSGDRAMFYEDWSDIPFYYWLADTFAIADHYHSSVIGPTWVNRDYLYAATSRGVTCNASDDYGGDVTTAYVYAGDIKANPPVIAALYPNNLDAGYPINTLYEDLTYLSGVKFTQWTRARYDGVPLPRFGTWYDPLAGLPGGLSLGPANNNPLTLDIPTQGYIKLYDANAPPGSSPMGSALAVAKPYIDWYKTLLGETPGFEANVAREEGLLEAALQGGANPLSLRPKGGLTQVNFIDPDKLEDVNAEDEHPPGPPRMGQRLVWDVVRVLMKNPEVWKRSALFITWDEHGGFYDHVKPPPACKPDNIAPGTRSVFTPLGWSGAYAGSSSTAFSDGKDVGGVPRTQDEKPDHSDPDYGGDFDRYGVRVPLLVISPWVKHSYVSHVTYDHTSITRFIELLYGMPAMTRRDANADPLLDLFDFSDLTSKLQGKSSDGGVYTDPSGNVFAGERLPSGDPVFSDVEVNYSLSPGWTDSANTACITEFQPAPFPSPFGELGINVWGGYDWSPGKPPPCDYDPTRDDVAVCGDKPDSGMAMPDAGTQPDGGACQPLGSGYCDSLGCCAGLACSNVSNDCSGADPYYECTGLVGASCDSVNGPYCYDKYSCQNGKCCDVGVFYPNRCGTETAPTGDFCHKPSDCCLGLVCALIPHQTGRFCCVPDGYPCTTNQPCCSGQYCLTGTCFATGPDGGAVQVPAADGGMSPDDGGCR